MSNVSWSLSILTAFSLALTACGGGAGGKKTAIRKGQKGGDKGWIKDTDIRQENIGPVQTGQGKPGSTVVNKKTYCLSVEKLANRLQAKGVKDENAKKEMLAIYTYDLDFVEVDSTSARTVVKPVNPASDALNNQKRNFFFAVAPESLAIDTVASESLLSKSNLGGFFFGVAKQTECKAVAFSNGPVFEIMSGYTPRRVVLRRGNEYRIYERDGIGQFRVSIVESKKVPVCANGDKTEYSVKREYMIARSRDLNRIVIGKNLGLMFNAASGSQLPELNQQLNDGKKLGHARLSLSAHTYEYLAGLIRQGKVEKIPGCTKQP